MAKTSGKKYRPWTPDTYATLTFSPAQRLPEGDLVFFVLDVVGRLDLSRFYAPYEKVRRGAPPFDPALLVCLLLYAYCQGVFSSRKIAWACERNLAFLAIVGDDRPDFRTISDFRKLHLDAFADTFTDVLRLAHEAGLVKLGVLATDGSKMQGNASRHKAMSYGYMTKEAERLRGEIDALLRQAQEHDDADDAALGSSRGDELPAELQRREDRRATIAAAMERLEEQARQEAEAQRQRREEAEAERQRTGRKRRGGRAPKPIDETPDPKAQTNFTDPQLRIMRLSNKGFEYCGNGQVVVDGACQIIVACDVVADANDKGQAVPMARQALANLEQAGIARPTGPDGTPVAIPNLTDSGYYSAEAARGLAALGLEPYMATARQRHHPVAPADAAVAPAAVVAAVVAVVATTAMAADTADTGATAAPAAAGAAEGPALTAQEQMAAKLRTASGRALYARRKVIVEPVFGQIKGARGFRRFLLRGLEKIRGEWRLVCLTHNLLKIWRYRCAPCRN